MPIDATCPGCQAKLRIGDEFAGQDARCPRCDTIYTVPAAPQAAQATEPAVASPTADVQPIIAVAESAPPAPSLVEDLLDSRDHLPLAPGRWYLRTPEGPIYGPTDEPTFHRWVGEGRVTPDCFVACGDNVWRPATERFPALSAPKPKLQLRPETLQAVRKQPHRGVLILLLGIMGIVTTCPIPSIMAWVMGSYDLGEMHMGRMDDSGQGLTTAGRMLGLVFSMLYIGAAVVGMFVLVFVFARR